MATPNGTAEVCLVDLMHQHWLGPLTSGAFQGFRPSSRLSRGGCGVLWYACSTSAGNLNTTHVSGKRWVPFTRRIYCTFCYKHIRWLDVSVYNALDVEILQGSHELPHVEKSLVLAQRCYLRNKESNTNKQHGQQKNQGQGRNRSRSEKALSQSLRYAWLGKN